MGDSLGTYVQHVGGAGLVYNVTEYLFGHGINIENLETHTEEVLASLDFQHLSSNM
jgi:glycine cleavage system regulatory protein